ncbi:MAG: YqgE/AlgH family protein, partial [Gammaproteobacteria bacterium]|nr:YqgE/AlgH family protein [Gammaproteobacteria bacterium]
LFPELDDTHSYRGPVFHGGPLAQATVLALSGSEQLAEGEREPIVAGVYMSSDVNLFETLVQERNDDAQLRFYAGHASWGPGQLEEEISAGAWRTVTASASLIFDPDPGSLWDRLATSGTGMTVRRAPAAPPRSAQARIDRSVREAFANAE